MHDHEIEFPGHDRAALMRKHSTLCQKQTPTGDPDYPEEVKLAKQIKCQIGNKAAVGDAKEEFNLKEIKFGESGANPGPSSNGHTEVAEATEASSTHLLMSRKTLWDCCCFERSKEG